MNVHVSYSSGDRWSLEKAMTPRPALAAAVLRLMFEMVYATYFITLCMDLVLFLSIFYAQLYLMLRDNQENVGSYIPP